MRYTWIVIAIAVLFSGCETSSVSGCKGRANGVKSGPTTLELPYPSGVSHAVTQSWLGTFSHSDDYALDFDMDYNDDIYPVAAGRVIAVKEDSDVVCTGPCMYGNYVIVDHGNGYLGRYYHFCTDCVDVVAGQLVTTNTRLGGAGTVGQSTGVHLHFELADWEEGCSTTYGFADINAGAQTALTAGQSYTSSNSDNSTYTPSTITGDTYKSQGVVLTSQTPWYLAKGTTITLTGTTTSTSSYDSIMVFIVDLTNTLIESSKTTISASSGSFNATYTIPSDISGTYSLGISGSKSGSYSWNNPPQIVIY